MNREDIVIHADPVFLDDRGVREAGILSDLAASAMRFCGDDHLIAHADHMPELAARRLAD
ncbi:hypothetical protein CCAE64S_01156 [Castellaniella caeni]